MIDPGRFILRCGPLFVAACLLLGPANTLPAQTLTKIMLLGDSITAGFEGSNPIGGFRDDLDSMLVDAGAEFDFVGTQSDGVGFDTDHEGHGGWTVDMILAQIDSFLVASNPDMVLIHLGTNDISANQGVQSTIQDMDQLLAAIFTFKPSMIVHLSALIPRNDAAGPEKDNLTSQLNVGYEGLVFDYRMSGRSIRLVDQNGAFKSNPYWQTDYLSDHVHPTNLGYSLMAHTFFDTLGSEDIFDIIPPAQITDLYAIDAGPRTVRLQWTATGDDGTSGTADLYDVRYSTEPLLTPSQFDSAPEAIGEPIPSPSGAVEEFTVGGLEPGTTYYFALKAMDEADNPSPMSNFASDVTLRYPALIDDFERLQPGPDWALDPDFMINDGELSNESLEERWDFMGSFVPTSDAVDVSLRWGSNADPAGIQEGGLAVMLDAPSPDANGYLIFRHDSPGYYALWTIVQGVPDVSIARSPDTTMPLPGPGDVFQVVVSSDANGHNFDCYVNGVYDTRVVDPAKTRGNGPDLWAGAMLHGNRNNNLEEFTVSGASADVPPEPFALLSPATGDTAETGSPLLDWEDAIDRNIDDPVHYTLYYGTSAVFAPDSTTVVDSLTESEYGVPPAYLAALLRRPGAAVRGVSPEVPETFGAPVRLAAIGGRLPGIFAPGGPRPAVLPDNVVVYWKVKAYDTTGFVTMSEQTDWFFHVWIPEAPLPFGLLEPAEGDTVGLMPTLRWETSSDPDSGDVVRYTVTYDTDSTFQVKPVRISNLETTSFSTPPLTDSTWYWWKVEAEDTRGLVTRSDEVSRFFALSTVGIGDDGGGAPGLPKAFALSQNYPNPFNPATTIRFDIPAGPQVGAGLRVRLQVYDVRGRRVRTLLDAVREPGRHEVHWDGRDDRGVKVESGVYLYRVDAGSFSSMRKMVLMK